MTLSKSLLAAALCLAVATPAMARNITVTPERVPAYWQVTNTSVDIDVPNSARNTSGPGCAAVAYTIDGNGNVSQPVAKKVVPAGDFATIAVSAVSRFHYAAVRGTNDNWQPIDTYYVVQFNMPTDPAAKAALLKQCELPGYAS